MNFRFTGAALLCFLAGCSSVPEPAQQPAPPSAPESTPPPQSQKKGGGYYLDDGPDANPPPNLDQIADAQPRKEPPHPYANRPYTVMGQSFVPISTIQNFRQRGVASWYGKRFHGQKTSSGEIYDMYAMTAAHPTLPIPSYVRVTNLENGRSVVVRINDRGPFLHQRVIDLSYAAAHRLDYLKKGSAKVEVEAVLPPEEKSPTALSESPSATQTAGGLTKHYLQLGAFSSRSNAEKMQGRVAAISPPIAESLSIVSVDALFRVYLGPYANRDDAVRSGERVRQLLDVQPHLILR